MGKGRDCFTKDPRGLQRHDSFIIIFLKTRDGRGDLRDRNMVWVLHAICGLCNFHPCFSYTEASLWMLVKASEYKKSAIHNLLNYHQKYEFLKTTLARNPTNVTVSVIQCRLVLTMHAVLQISAGVL